jgi:PAS domain S-box-containing protein
MRLEQFERRQNELWQLAFLLLFILTIFFAWISWDSTHFPANHYKVLPIGLVVLVALFGLHMWRKSQEIHRLRELLRGLKQRDAAPPSEKQLDHLYELITRSQQGYRELIDSFDEMLLALTPEGNIRAANRSFAELVEAPFQRIIGHPILDFLEGAEAGGQKADEHSLQQFLEQRHWAGVVKTQVRGSNTPRYFDCVAHAMVRGDKVHGITLLARDITALRESEARFTELFETLQEGIYITTPDDRMVDANPALVRILGYDSKEELLSRRVSELFENPKERTQFRREAKGKPEMQGREIRLLRKDGKPVVCLSTATAVRDASGAVVRYQGALMDVTEQREMARRLYKEQEFARQLVESFPDLILVLNTAGHYTFVSARVKDILGYDLDETGNMTFGERTHPEDRSALHTLFDEVVAGGKTFASLEIRIQHRQGDWRRMRLHFSPLYNEAGKIEGVVISARDVTQLKRLEEQLIQSEKLAAMGQMLAGVAHELNNPLTAVLGVTELLRERADLDAAAKRQLELMHRQARRAARIVQNLLYFSRPAAPQKKLLGVSPLVERTLQLHEHSLRQSKIAVEFHPDPALPAVLGDANQLIQVFLNLITNAEHAIREVRESGKIVVRLHRAGDRVAVTIQDDGVGIRREALPKLFDPFYTTKRPGGGTGLGLSICMAIVREHHGSIEAETLPGGGSAFTVLLPAAGQPQAASTVMDTAAHTVGELRQMADVLKGRSVLVVDDEESIRQLLEEGLTAQGLRVDCAADCAGALACVQRIEYDAVLCDLNLTVGGVSGKETAERILRAQARKPAIIFMTGDLMTDSGADAGGGPRWRLQKPFRVSEALAILAEVFSASKESLAK